MFLRRYVNTKDGKKHTYFALVESLRTDAGPRQHIVAYLGELNHDQERRWQRTVVFHNRQGDTQQLRLFPDDDSVPLPDDPDVVRVRLIRSAGPMPAASATSGWHAGSGSSSTWMTSSTGTCPRANETVRPADIVAIEVINRLCDPCSEFALAEHWYASTGLEDLLGVPDEAVTKDRLYRTLDRVAAAKEPSRTT